MPTHKEESPQEEGSDEESSVREEDTEVSRSTQDQQDSDDNSDVEILYNSAEHPKVAPILEEVTQLQLNPLYSSGQSTPVADIVDSGSEFSVDVALPNSRKRRHSKLDPVTPTPSCSRSTTPSSTRSTTPASKGPTATSLGGSPQLFSGGRLASSGGHLRLSCGQPMSPRGGSGGASGGQPMSRGLPSMYRGRGRPPLSRGYPTLSRGSPPLSRGRPPLSRGRPPLSRGRPLTRGRPRGRPPLNVRKTTGGPGRAPALVPAAVAVDASSLAAALSRWQSCHVTLPRLPQVVESCLSTVAGGVGGVGHLRFPPRVSPLLPKITIRDNQDTTRNSLSEEEVLDVITKIHQKQQASATQGSSKQALELNNCCVCNAEGYYFPFNYGHIESGADLFLRGEVTLQSGRRVTLSQSEVITSYYKQYSKDRLVLYVETEGAVYTLNTPQCWSTHYLRFIRLPLAFNDYTPPAEVVILTQLDDLHPRPEKDRHRGEVKPIFSGLKREEVQSPDPVAEKKPRIGAAELLKSFGADKADVVERLSRGLSYLPSNICCDQETMGRIAAFLFFVAERQSIWWKKRGEEKTLTNNPVFRVKKFTNIFRELDRGTGYFREQISPTLCSPNISIEDKCSSVLFKSLVYRLLNKIETFTSFGGIPNVEATDKFINFIEKRMASGEIVFTSAHQTNGKVRYIASVNDARANLVKLSKDILKSPTTQSAFNILKTLTYVGDFFAWQILCDLLESRVLPLISGQNDEDSWVCLGPGAVDGLKYIFARTNTTNLDGSALLRDICNSGFQLLQLKFSSPLGKPMDLKAVEHALCEFSKYTRHVGALKSMVHGQFAEKSRAYMDTTKKCLNCHSQSSTVTSATTSTPASISAATSTTASARVFCIYCNQYTHRSCLQKKVSPKDAWVCKDCLRIEQY